MADSQIEPRRNQPFFLLWKVIRFFLGWIQSLVLIEIKVIFTFLVCDWILFLKMFSSQKCLANSMRLLNSLSFLKIYLQNQAVECNKSYFSKKSSSIMNRIVLMMCKLRPTSHWEVEENINFFLFFVSYIHPIRMITLWLPCQHSIVNLWLAWMTNWQFL